MSGLVLVDGAIGNGGAVTNVNLGVTKREYLKFSDTPPKILESLPIFRKAMKRSLEFWNKEMETMLDTTIELDPTSGRVLPRTPDSVGKHMLEELWRYNSSAQVSRLPRVPVMLAIAQSKQVHKTKLNLSWLDESVRIWKEWVDDLKIDFFPDTSHYVMVQRPRKLAKEINAFLASG